MRIESPAGMEQRLPTNPPSRLPRQAPPSRPRKHKRRSGRRSNPLETVLDDTWPNVVPPSGNQDGGLVAAGVEYPPQMLWQPTDVQPQSVPGNGQRLFTAMSDPSVCGYSPMPMTYAMQPVSLPTMYRMYQPMPVPNVRTVHGRHRLHYNKHLANVRPNNADNNVNGYGSPRENGAVEPAVHIALQNGDYASLPPTANKDSGVNGDELNSEHRRYSDPGLGPAGNSGCTDSDDSESSVESGSSVTTISRSNKLVLSLIEQMTELKKCNGQLFKELSETKSNLENVKAKLAQCKHSTPADYQPGMLSELIREVREANRNCEESLVAKVKSMLEERCNQQAKEVDELKNQLAKLMKEKEESDQRVAKLEEEMTVLKLSATNEGREIAVFEEENLALRRELQEARASRTLAENHAAKCVNLAVSRSVTPVTFDTPCVTSTPVRTALASCFLLPAVLPASHTFSSDPSTPRPRSAEVTLRLISDASNRRRSSATDSGPVSREDSPTDENARPEMSSASRQTVAVTCTNGDAANAIGAGLWNKIETQSSGSVDTKAICEIMSMLELNDYFVPFDREEARDVGETRNDSEVKTVKEETMTEEDLRTKHLISTDSLEPAGNQALVSREMKMPSIMEKDEAKDLESSKVLEEQNGLPDKLNDAASKAEKFISHSDNHSFWQKLCKFNNQRGSFKKSRRKKASLRRLFSEGDKDPREDTENPVGTVSQCSSESNRDTGDEDEDDRYGNDSSTGRAITDVPDVVVINGGSIVPNNLCSTRTLTSRTQTAPSRATYTTAYI